MAVPSPPLLFLASLLYPLQHFPPCFHPCVGPSCMTLNFLFWFWSCLRIRKIILEAPCSLLSSPSPPALYTIPCTTPAVLALVSILPPSPSPLSYFFFFIPHTQHCSVSIPPFWLFVCLFVCFFAAVTTINPHHIILSPFLRTTNLVNSEAPFLFSAFPLPSTRPHWPSMCVVFTPLPVPSLTSYKHDRNKDD